MATVFDLGKRVKLKYPGSYDDVDDETLGRMVQRKYPGVYDDFIDESTEKSLGEFVSRKLPESAKATGGQILSAIAHPIETVKAIGRVATGAAEKFVPGEQAQESAFDALMDFYKTRYGSFDSAKETAYNDPIGFLMDASTVLAGLGSGLAFGAKGAAVATAGRALRPSGQIASAASEGLLAASSALDPIRIAAKVVGETTRAAVAGRRIAPFRGKADKKVIEASKRLEINLPASAGTTSRVVPVIEAIEGKGFFGGTIAVKVDAANEKLNAIADKMVRETGASPDIIEAGKAVSNGLDAYHATWVTTKNALYDEAMKLMGKSEININAEKTKAFLEQIIRNKREAQAVTPFVEDVPFWESQLKYMEDAPIGVKAWRQAIKELNQKAKTGTDPIITGNKATVKRLVATMSDDLDDTLAASRPDIGEALTSANAVYKDGIERLNSALGKKLGAMKSQVDRIVPKLMDAGTSAEELERIFEVIPEEAKNSVRAATMERMFAGARTPGGNFKPAGLQSQLRRMGQSKLSILFSPEQIETLSDISEISRGLGKVERVLSGSQTAYLARVGAGLAGIFTNWLVAFQVIVGDALLSKFITSPVGQRLLTEGIPLTGSVGAKIENIGPQAGRIGRAAFQGERVREEATAKAKTNRKPEDGVWTQAVRNKAREARINP